MFLTDLYQIKNRSKYEVLLKQLPQHILFSVTEKIQRTINPAMLFAAGYKDFYGKRFYWKDPQDDLIIVSFGHVQTLQAKQDDQDRFSYIENEWNQIINTAMIKNDYLVSGTGPLILGGFSFDQSTVTQEWESFAYATFHIPQIIFTFTQGELYLTINLKTDVNDIDTLLSVEEHIQKLLQSIDAPQLSLPNIVQNNEIGADHWKQAVQKTIDRIRNGEMDKVVLARKMRIEFDQPILSEQVLYNLLKQQYESYIFALEGGNQSFIGASPERLIQKENEQILSTCLAGSIKRSQNLVEDEKLGHTLLQDEKNQKEHHFVVSMIKQVLQPFCKELSIPDSPTLMKMRDIQHLYTPVRGEVKDKHETIFKLVKALHPTPALGGIPCREAMATIRDVENMDRGFYGAPLGWVDYKGNGEFCVGIRSGLLKENEAYIYAGCGVVGDSNPDEEFKETSVKFKPMLRALGGNE